MHLLWLQKWDKTLVLYKCLMSYCLQSTALPLFDLGRNLGDATITNYLCDPDEWMNTYNNYVHKVRQKTCSVLYQITPAVLENWLKG
jgi:hypothetical protein